MAVLPFLSTTLTSLPSSSASLTASSASGGAPGVFARRMRAHSGGHHQRRRAVLVRQQRIGPQLDEQPHQLRVAAARRHEERRCADEVQRGHADVRAPRHARVHVGAVRLRAS